MRLNVSAVSALRLNVSARYRLVGCSIAIGMVAIAFEGTNSMEQRLHMYVRLSSSLLRRSKLWPALQNGCSALL